MPTIIFRHLIIVISTCIILIFIMSTMENSVFDSISHLVEYRKLSNLLQNRQSTTNDSVQSDKWIVMTSINYPTSAVKRYAQLNDWRLVVVGDRKTPKNWKNNHNLPNCIFLSFDEQIKLNYKILKLIPSNSYARKAVGYLYAIEHGAQWIYDTDDDNEEYDFGLRQFDMNNTWISGLIYGNDYNKSRINVPNISESIFNPYAYWGRRDIWPRGYPLEHVQTPNRPDQFHSCKSHRAPVIQQGIVAKDPDVDAIYRLLNADVIDGLDVSFDRYAPPITLLPGIYTPFNSQNTLFHYDAFWALLLPITVPFRVCDIWRGYYAQKLMHLLALNSYLAFYPINAIQKRNPHSYLSDFKDELPLYSDTANMIAFLSNWSCLNETDLKICMSKLSRDFVEFKFWQYDDYRLTNMWIDDLRNIKYKFPKVRQPDYVDPFNDDLSLSTTVNDKYVNCRPAYYLANNPTVDRSMVAAEYFGHLEDWCNWNSSSHDDNGTAFEFFYPSDGVKQSNMSTRLLNVALVITFNFPVLPTISVLQRVYTPYFGNVIFCGTFITSILSEGKEKFPDLLPYSFVNVTRTEMANGALAYYCLAKVHEMRLSNIIGYAVMADDTVYNVMHEIDLRRFHMQHTLNGGFWWSNGGAKSVNRIIQTIRYRTGVNNQSQLSVAWNEYSRSVGGDGYAILGAPKTCAIADWYYVPSEKMWVFYELAEIMAEARLFHEIAVPKIGAGIGFLTEYQDRGKPYAGQRARWPFLHIWGGDRAKWYKILSRNMTSLHPVKLSSTATNRVERYRVCNYVIKYLHRIVYGLS